ncbi:MAG TPA: MFS transporter, partial [Streptosporangiaceae bacterium]|nr:MFS transporter [Streptosporangiaceae bacterium]
MPRSTRGIYRGLPREVAILSAVSFTVALGYGIVAPSIPAFARQFGVSAAAAASVISAFALMRVVGALPAGRLVDRFGERRTMAIGIGIVAVSSLVAGLSHSFVQLIVLRGVGGLGSAMFGVSAQTLLLRTVRSEQRGRASGLYSGGFLLGSISGPAIGGLVAAWSLRAPFFIYGVMLAVPTAIAFAVLRDQPAQADDADAPVEEVPAAGGVLAGGQVADTPVQTGTGQRPGTLAGLRNVLRSRAYQAAAAANLADGFAVLGVRSAIVPLFVRDVLHKSPTWTGIGFGVVAALNAAMLLPAGRVADTIGRRPVIVGGCLLSAAGMVLLAFVPGVGGFLAAMAALGLGSGMLDVAPAAMIGDLLGKPSPARPDSGPSRTDRSSEIRDQSRPSGWSDAGSEGDLSVESSWSDGSDGSGGEDVRAGAASERDAGRPGRRAASTGEQRVGGTVVASYQMAGDVGAVTGPIAVGFLVDSVSYGAAFIL